MTREEYKQQIIGDINNYIIKNNIDINSVDEELLYDSLWVEDSVTGNASGKYTCNSRLAQEYIGEAIWEKWLLDIFKEFGEDRIPLERGAKYIDVSIRCGLLGECISEVLRNE